MDNGKYYLSSSPHFSFGGSTQKIMLGVLIALMPEVIAGVVFFGVRALILVLVSVLGAVIFEALFQKITNQKIIVKNLSACVTGVMLALVCSPTTPVWMILLGDLVAIVVAKGLFGGLGSNVFNPALTGRAVLLISFPSALGASWIEPKINSNAVMNMDAVSSATPLTAIKNGAFEVSSSTYFDFFIGNKAGCIGETSVLLILLSFIFLLVVKIIDWRAPLSMVATVVLGTFLASIKNGFDFALSQSIFSVLTGGLMFGAVFMVTDYATTPVTHKGRLIFGFGCGLITFLIRQFGGYPEGVMFSILIMNSIAPFLNNFNDRIYGYGKKGNRRPNVDKISMEFDIKNATKVKDSGEAK
ncbi:MAG: RnfABCDGE type electron transport complex subunit D [Treponema sp.]|nr:RnfABCDGE type electron transport complex subunit D [Treponema sp.]